jgi:gamma-glutamylcyclotransferase (GGCT)/AIG2-like uncharacterized protein YtfP
MSKEKLKICVYGSLRRGMGNHPLMRDSKLLSTETISDNFEMIDMGSFPGLVETDEPNEIVIEVYEVTPDVFRNIERLESYPSWYNRRNVTTTEGEVGIYYFPGKNSNTNKDRLVTKTDGAFDWVLHYRNKHYKYE